MSAPKPWGKPIALLLLIPMIFVLSSGFNLVKDARAYPVPVVVTYAEFRHKSPAAGRYTIKNCLVDLSHCVMDTENNLPVRVYAPVFDAMYPEHNTTTLYAEMDDRATLTLMIDMIEKKRFDAPQDYQAWLAQNRAKFFVHKEISGLVSVGVRSPIQNLDKEFGKTAAVDFHDLIFIADGWQPNPTKGYLALGMGIAALAVVGVVLLKK